MPWFTPSSSLYDHILPTVHLFLHSPVQFHRSISFTFSLLSTFCVFSFSIHTANLSAFPIFGFPSCFSCILPSPHAASVAEDDWTGADILLWTPSQGRRHHQCVPEGAGHPRKDRGTQETPCRVDEAFINECCVFTYEETLRKTTLRY